MSKYVPHLAAAVAVVYLLLMTVEPADRDGDMRLQQFARLPVVYQGRCKPFDTLARNSLMAISGRQSFVDEAGHAQPAIRWLLDVMTDRFREGGPARKHKVFRIENDQVLNLLGLRERSGFRYSIDEFVDQIATLEENAKRARGKEKKDRELSETKVLELYDKIQLYQLLATLSIPHMVPPKSGEEKWKPLIESFQQRSDDPAVRSLVSMLVAYANGKTDDFNRELEQYQKFLEDKLPKNVSKANHEVFFNNFQPFYHGIVLYGIVLALVFVGWLGNWSWLREAGFWVLIVTFVLHLFAQIFRMYLQGYPPVTNLYSSAVFIGLGSVILGMILELLYKNGIGTVVGAGMGFVTLIIAHNLASGGDTLEMMQAVLDTNFWLATHVTCVTTGYAATFVAGLLGILFILGGVLTKAFDRQTMLNLNRMTYAIICFATFFSFTGTVLGGIWADQSWGRFWGWDPKENGALIIVLWNALILHARWGAVVRQRGVAVLAVFGNIVTSWSWFGVNMLGVGLHSYGFLGTALFWMILFVSTQVAIIGVGLIPIRLWKSSSAWQAPAKV